jgi:threonyl-tRNA synthetase
VAPAFNDYATKVAASLAAKGIRVQADLGAERMNNKIRVAQGQRIPYMLVVGQREQDEGTVSIRRRDGKQTPPMKTGDFEAYILEKVRTLALDL